MSKYCYIVGSISIISNLISKIYSPDHGSLGLIAGGFLIYIGMERQFNIVEK